MLGNIFFKSLIQAIIIPLLSLALINFFIIVVVVVIFVMLLQKSAFFFHHFLLYALLASWYLIYRYTMSWYLAYWHLIFQGLIFCCLILLWFTETHIRFAFLSNFTQGIKINVFILNMPKLCLNCQLFCLINEFSFAFNLNKRLFSDVIKVIFLIEVVLNLSDQLEQFFLISETVSLLDYRLPLVLEFGLKYLIGLVIRLVVRLLK